MFSEPVIILFHGPFWIKCFSIEHFTQPNMTISLSSNGGSPSCPPSSLRALTVNQRRGILIEMLLSVGAAAAVGLQMGMLWTNCPLDLLR